MNMIDIPNILRTKTLEEISKIATSIQDKNTRYLLLGSAFLKYKRYQYAYEFLKHVKHQYPRLFSYAAFYIGKHDEVLESLKDSNDILDLIILTISAAYTNKLDIAKVSLDKAIKIDKNRTLELLTEYIGNMPKSPYRDAILIQISKLLKRRY